LDAILLRGDSGERDNLDSTHNEPEEAELGGRNNADVCTRMDMFKDNRIPYVQQGVEPLQNIIRN